MKYQILFDCVCERDLHELTHHYRDGLPLRTLSKGDVVEHVEEFTNLYGRFLRVSKEGKTYDIKPTNLKRVKQ